jgi:hypothetical protein
LLSLKPLSDSFDFTTKTVIYIDLDDAELRLMARMLVNQIAHVTNHKLPVKEKTRALSRIYSIILIKNTLLILLKKKGITCQATPGHYYTSKY